MRPPPPEMGMQQRHPEDMHMHPGDQPMRMHPGEPPMHMREPEGEEPYFEGGRGNGGRLGKGGAQARAWGNNRSN